MVTSKIHEIWGKPKTIKLVFVAFAKHAALTRKSKDGLARNQDNVSEWGDTSNPQIAVSVS